MQQTLRRVAAAQLAGMALMACWALLGCQELPGDHDTFGDAGANGRTSLATSEHALVDCTESTDTGYVKGTPFPITVVTVDGKKVERDTANAYWVMQQAAAASGVSLQIISGFRTMAQQQYLYDCYTNCNCNNCNLAARPGYSNHQSGHALDLNTSAPGVLNWLNNHGAAYGFTRTVPSENWHWEWWGGGPDGGPCGACEPHCEGSVMVGRDCGRGDCGVFGSNCVNDAQGLRCVFYACPATGDVAVCLDDQTIGNCSNGGISTGDCGAFAAYCSTAGAAEAHCASVFCVDSPQQVPVAHDGCFLDGSLSHCDANGGLTLETCPAGETCNVFPTPHCEADLPCPPGNDIWACIDDTVIGRCWGGGVIEAGDCGAYAAYCSTAGGVEPRCVSMFCVDSPTEVPVARDVCLPDGSLGHCDANGVPTPSPCPEGQTCYTGVGGATCIDLYCGDKLGTSGCTDTGQLFVCDELGGLTINDCPADQHCSSLGDAACVVGTPCGPGATRGCLDTHTLATCAGGAVIASETCTNADSCVLDDQGEARCVNPACWPSAGATPPEGAFCVSELALGTCNSDGTVTIGTLCGAGQRCAETASGAVCTDASVSDVPSGDAPGADASRDAAPADVGARSIESDCGCQSARSGSPGSSWSVVLGLLLAVVGLRRTRRP